MSSKGQQFRATGSAAEMAMMDSEGYAEGGLAEHKDAGGKHLGEHWHKGMGGLRPEGEDYEDEQARLQELEQRAPPKGIIMRAMGAVGSTVAAVAGAVMPGLFKTSRSAAELAYGDAEGYAAPGLAEHKDAGGKHLGEHWHKGMGGLRPEGEDYEDEQARLQELEQRQAGGVVQRAKDTVASTAAAATEKAGEYLQAAKEMVGMEPKK